MSHLLISWKRCNNILWAPMTLWSWGASTHQPSTFEMTWLLYLLLFYVPEHGQVAEIKERQGKSVFVVFMRMVSVLITLYWLINKGAHPWEAPALHLWAVISCLPAVLCLGVGLLRFSLSILVYWYCHCSDLHYAAIYRRYSFNTSKLPGI